ncbi:hypothetical protein SAMN05421869_132110 [Nonomuraea jiangxiensis]|uniref:Uncharacterized protein n=1 Tax=Nonomuraea jiangxiensis TaxID=633440 RepID=A0A1G9NV39_9ACTN|nr:hypothetical protein SAMN05421869_132110 [Nonomuraea jiangxiensis]
MRALRKERPRATRVLIARSEILAVLSDSWEAEMTRAPCVECWPSAPIR